MANENKTNRGKQKLNIAALIRVIGMAVLIVAVIVAAAVAIDSGKGKTQTAKSVSSFNVGAAAVEALLPYPGGVAAVADSAVYYFDVNGYVISVIEHNYSSPAAQINGKNLVLYDLGGKKMRVEKRGGIYSEIEPDGIITSAAVGKRGSYAYSLNSHGGFQSHLFVFSGRGKKVFEWGSSSDYISCISLSDNGKYCAVSLLSADNAQPVSRIKLFAVSGEEALFSVDLPSAVVYDMAFVSSKKLLVFSNDGVYSFDFTGNPTKLAEFSATEVKCYGGSASGLKAVSLAVFGNENNSKVIVFDQRGKLIFEKNMTGEVTGVACSANRVSVVLRDKIENYDIKGNLTGTVNLGQVCRKTAVSGKKSFFLTERGLYACAADTNGEFSAFSDTQTDGTTAESVTERSTSQNSSQNTPSAADGENNTTSSAADAAEQNNTQPAEENSGGWQSTSEGAAQ